jgi:hypothetical protein
MFAAEDRRLLGEVRRRDINRLAEMADEIAPDVSAASLRTVQERDRPLDAAKRQARAERRAELARVARRRAVLVLRLVEFGRDDDLHAHASFSAGRSAGFGVRKIMRGFLLVRSFSSDGASQRSRVCRAPLLPLFHGLASVKSF